MKDQGGNTLLYIEQLLQQGNRQAALQPLAAYLKRNPRSVQAWWLLSQAVTDKIQQIDCLERVLKMNPGHAPAKARLASLKASSVPFAFSTEEEFAFKALVNGSLPASQARQPSEAKSPGRRSPETPGPVPAAPKTARKPAARKKKMGVLEISVLAILACVLVASFGTLGTLALRQKMANDLQATQVMAQARASHPPQTLPPTWTATVTPTLLPPSTLAPTDTPSPTVVFSIPATNTHALSGWRSITLGPSAPSGPGAPDFTLKEVTSGNQVSLSDYAGRPVVLVFWTTWCPYCEREMSVLKSTYNAYQDAGLVILAINEADSASDVRSYRKSHSLDFPVLLDPKRKAGGLYKVASYPMHVFINRSGQAVYTVKGMLDSAGLNSRVQIIAR